MPLYEYQCDACEHRFEVIQKYSDPPIDVCPKCGGVVQKLLSSPAIQFKGSGFYLTDYGRGGKSDTAPGASEKSSAGGAPGDKKDKSEGSGDSKSESKTENKGETKSESKSESKNETKIDTKGESKSDSKPSPSSPGASKPVSD